MLVGEGAVANALAHALLRAGFAATLVTAADPVTELAEPAALGAGLVCLDVLTQDAPLPPGHLVLVEDPEEPPAYRAWRVVMETAVRAARIVPRLAGRAVTVVSAEVHGDEGTSARGRGAVGEDELDSWCRDLLSAAALPCPPWQVAARCRDLADRAGGSVRALATRARERLLVQALGPDALTVLRTGSLFGPGLGGPVARLVRAARAGRALTVGPGAGRFLGIEALARAVAAGLGPGSFDLAGPTLRFSDLAERIATLIASPSPILADRGRAKRPPSPADTAGLGAGGSRIGPLEEPLASFLSGEDRPPLWSRLEVVRPPRPSQPDVVAHRQQSCLWNGSLKCGNRWSSELQARLRGALELDEGRELVLVGSGTQALRLAVVGAAGRARPGAVAVLPSFTFPTTWEVLEQLGYRLRFADVDRETWTLDPVAVQGILAGERVDLVVAVDTFGNPCDYERLGPLCAAAGVPFVSDSAAALGSRFQGRPVGSQADGHAFSMSFAKNISAAGSGGVAVLSAGGAAGLAPGWTRPDRLGELNAIVALDQLDVLEAMVEQRTRLAAVYREACETVPLLVPQLVRPGDRHSFVHWVTRVRGAGCRDAVAKGLARAGIATRRYFEPAVPAFAGGTPLPVTEELRDEVLALPMSSELSLADAERVVFSLEDALAEVLPAAAWTGRVTEPVS